MLQEDLQKINENFLLAVCGEKWPESQTLDFKRTLPDTQDKSRHELLKDVCAFANAGGGDLVFGISEKNGKADQIHAIPVSTHPVDDTKRRLGQILDSGLEPRVDGVIMHSVPLKSGDYVLIIRVPASFRRPHRYKVSDPHTRWAVRADTHIVDMTYDQIRDAFDRTATLTDRARGFLDERLAAVISGTTGRKMRAGPRCVVHLIPLASVARTVSIDVQQLYRSYEEFKFFDWTSASPTFTLDGVVINPAGDAEDVAYTLIFRFGVMEAARFGGSLFTEDEDMKKAIPSYVVSGFIRDALIKFITAATKRWQIAGPAIAAAALLDIGDSRFFYQPPRYFTQSSRSDRENLILPDVWIDQLSAVDNPDKVVQPLLDTLWQSFNLERCMFYDAQGRWGQH